MFNVVGVDAPYELRIRNAQGEQVTFGVTSGQGVAILLLPQGPGLVLDVVDTTVFDVPVVAGVPMRIVVP